MKIPDLRDYAGQRVHLVGVGGSSMSGLARMLHQQGYLVSGSDRAAKSELQSLVEEGIHAYTGHRPAVAAQAALLVYSAAISPADPERQAARDAGVPQMERGMLLGQLMRPYAQRACVCGTHGKTTVSSMIAQLLVDCGLNPAVHIGGSLDAIGGSTRLGDTAMFVAEACEFNRSFLHMSPTLAILTNIEEDHLDCYRDIEEIQAAFEQFVALVPPGGQLIGLLDDARVMDVMRGSGRAYASFSLEGPADWTAGSLTFDALGCARFEALHGGEKVGDVCLIVPGHFNALHALAALAAARALGADMQGACASLGRFRGAHRRFEYTGEVQGMRLYHDYGHNPAEMQSAIAVAAMQGRRVIAVMQPHTYSRVKGLFEGYLTCTAAADITLVTDIYAAREADPGDINSGMLVGGMRAHGIDAHLTPDFESTRDWLLRHGRRGDLVLTMGCGDINLLNDMMQSRWDAQHTNTEGIL